MRDPVYNWVKTMVSQYRLFDQATLEVGSFDVNGSIAPLFGGPYWGVDMRRGPGVDQVCDGEALPFPDSSYPVVISTDTLEHVAHPWLFVNEMARVASGFVVITTCLYGYPEHDFPHDYWRFGRHTLQMLMAEAGLEVREVAGEEGMTVFCLGVPG